MKTGFVIAGHHLRRVWRAPGLILLLLAIPITIALIEYAAFGPTVASGKLPPIKVLFLDEDRTFVSSAVPQFFAGGPLKEYFELGTVERREDTRRMFERGTASALIVIPKGFQDAVLDGRKVALELYKNPIQAFSPEIAESVLVMGTVLANGLYAYARDPIASIRAFRTSGRDPTADEVAEISRGFYRAGQQFAKFSALQDLSVEVQRPSGQKGALYGVAPGEFFGTIFPGLALFALLFISQSLALRLLRDRTLGLQRRLLITPATRASVLIGGMLYLLIGLLLLLVVLAVLGSLVFRITLRNPAALVLFGVGFALFATGLQLCLMGNARSERGAQAVSGLAVMLLSLLGGTFVPAESLPPFLRSVAVAIPNGAAQHALVGVLVHHQNLADVAAAAAVVWLWATLFLVIGFFLERRQLTSVV